MHKRLLFFSLFAFVMFFGCATFVQISATSQMIFTYDYTLEGKDKLTLWKTARNYLASIYMDSKDVFQVLDEEEGTIIGKGFHQWYVGGTAACGSFYHIRFAAKEGKVRLQFEIIPGPTSNCGYKYPTESGYNSMVSEFQGISNELKKALQEDFGSGDFKDF